MKPKAPRERKSTNFRDDALLVRIGLNIRSKREAKGLSIEELATIMEVDYSQVQRIELGQRNFTISYLSLFARALDVPMADLLK